MHDMGSVRSVNTISLLNIIKPATLAAFRLGPCEAIAQPAVQGKAASAPSGLRIPFKGLLQSDMLK